MTLDPTVDPSPPPWAEYLLRSTLGARDVDTVSGDLLEEYREHIFTTREPRDADLWYVTQAVGFAARNAAAWALLFAAAFLARTALDWRVPTHDFHARSAASTLLGVGIFLVAGLRAGSRSGSFSAGVVTGAIISLMSAPMQLLGAGVLLVLWHDPTTLAAIRGSGGVEEVFLSPFTTIVPGVVMGALGGALGITSRYWRAA
jgi:hypothetical protein